MKCQTKAKLRVRTLKWDENQFLYLVNSVRCVECVLMLVYGWVLLDFICKGVSFHCSFNIIHIFIYCFAHWIWKSRKDENESNDHDHKRLTFMYPLRCARILFTLNLSIQPSDSRTLIIQIENIAEQTYTNEDQSKNQTASKKAKIVFGFCICLWREIQISKTQWTI